MRKLSVLMRPVADSGRDASLGAPERRPWRRRLGLAAAFAVAVAIGGSPGATTAATGDIGYADQLYTGTSSPTGTKRAESSLWWNDGFWWANMWDKTSNDFHIFKLDLSGQTWVDTGVTVDTRGSTRADTLWDGTHLYIASHIGLGDELPAVSGYPAYLYRFSYDPAADTYSRDSGFPVAINNYKTETLVIDKDSTGKLWATWQQDNEIYVNRTVGDDRTWGTPFVLPVAATVTVDDNSSVIAFDGNKIGVMWSNETSTNDAMWFAVHNDADPDTTWQASRTAIQGQNSADDHINLKSLQTDGAGRVYAAVKTSHTGSSPLIMLLVRDPASGDWASYVFGRGTDCHNRPIVLIDEEARVIHMFATGPASPDYSCNSTGGAIYEKTSPLDAISFPLGYGTPVIQDADSAALHNVSSTKQNVNSRTGLVVLAVNQSLKQYWHSYESLAPVGPPPPMNADFTGAPTSGSAPLTVRLADTSSGSPTIWAWDFGDGGTSTAQNPTHTFSSPGTYTVSLAVTNATASDTETKVGYITVAPSPPPVADFTATPTTGPAPLAVKFTDTSSGSPASWWWDFGDGGVSTAQNPSHTYSAAGTYTVSLSVSNTSGTDTKTRPGYIAVSRTVVFAPVADAEVSLSSPKTNYGTTSQLRLRTGSTTKRSYLAFAPTGLTGTIISAKLRLYVNDGSTDGGSVYVVGNSWTETGITWNNAPVISGSALSSAGSAAAGTWKELDLKTSIGRDGTYSFGLANASNNIAGYESREAAHPPQLVVTLAP
jgi:PKD repeat protein